MSAFRFPLQTPEGISEIAPGVVCLSFFTVNAFLVGEPGGPWAVVDTGTPDAFDTIREAAAARFGKEARPDAIYLTHGHYDHAGSALALAAYWNVPVYAHPMELPYLTGQEEYPPLDPTTGGALAFFCRFFPGKAPDLSGFVLPLPEGTLPGMPGWEAIPAPGHAPGQVVFFRREGRVLLAGDACATVDNDKWSHFFQRKHMLVRSPAPSTPDWLNNRKSLQRLAKLLPSVLACGHGVPMSGPEVAPLLESVAEEFIIPLKGRYVSDPARFDENGVTYLPPQPADPLPKKVAGVVLVAALAGIGLYLLRKQRRNG